MSKQPESGRPSMSRPGSASPEQPAVSFPRLNTVGPGSIKAKPAKKIIQPPLKPKRRWKQEPESDNSAPTIQQTLATATGKKSADPAALKQLHSGTNGNGEASESFTISQRFKRHRHPLSSFFVSTLLHVGLLVALALFAFGWPQLDNTINILAEFDLDPTPEQTDDLEKQEITIEAPDDTESPLDDVFEEMSEVDDLKLTETENQSVPSIVESEETEPTVEPVTAVVTNAPTKPAGGGLEGRDSTARANLAAQNGGSEASEIAVENGLRWILAHQREDGSWKLKHDDGACNGQCPNEGGIESTTAATGLALMSLLGAGYTHEKGPYQKEVSAGLDYLISKMRQSSLGGSLREGERGMYAHAIATIAISEAAALTGDSRMINAADEARKYIESAQHKRGGWRYTPGSLGDLSVTGWQIMALKSCEQASLKTGEVTWQRAEDFVDGLGSTGGRFRYLQPSEEDPVMTAVGLLSKMYLGADRDDIVVSAGAEYLASKGPSPTNVYYNYYATLVLHHRRDGSWDKWNTKLRDYLVKTQDRSPTHKSGSWHFQDPHGNVGGRLYTTAMAIMTLEVYYRYMPLYEHDSVSDRDR